ncbi:MAG TPA: monovalent cation/H+ antiporter complex subunit F [Acidimicrobiia bacterium]|nr:monovalent cation/H+ antiporter complex subunit F [Acidimicrobiia bacterium]
MTVISAIAIGMLVAAAALLLVRFAILQAIADRVVILDALLVLLVGGIVIGAAATGNGFLLDVAMAVALVAFTATVTVARFVERQSR